MARVLSKTAELELSLPTCPITFPFLVVSCLPGPVTRVTIATHRRQPRGKDWCGGEK
jgi:hypothetical protein